jgi:hypothetical protein
MGALRLPYRRERDWSLSHRRLDRPAAGDGLYLTPVLNSCLIYLVRMKRQCCRLLTNWQNRCDAQAPDAECACHREHLSY